MIFNIIENHEIASTTFAVNLFFQYYNLQIWQELNPRLMQKYHNVFKFD